MLLIERAADLRTHAGQVAFPGGAVDPGDADEPAAALREANEEVGLDPASVEVLNTLPAIFIPVTGFVVTPVLAWWRAPHPVASVDPMEVARAAVVPIAELADPANRFRVRHPSGCDRARVRGRRPVRLGLHRRAARPAARAGRLGPAVGPQPARAVATAPAAAGVSRGTDRARYRRGMPAARRVPVAATCAAVAAVLALTACSNNRSAVNRRPQTGTATASAVAGVQQVTIDAGDDFRFHPSTVVVHPGRVRVILHHTGTGAPHDWSLTGLPKDFVPLVSAGQTGQVTFVAPPPGRYPFVCTMHAAQGMSGTLVVLSR